MRRFFLITSFIELSPDQGTLMRCVEIVLRWVYFALLTCINEKVANLGKLIV
jgi:hypothetical protein